MKKAMIRERISKALLDILELHPSEVFARLQLQILLGATARAFDQRGQCILFAKDPLQEYGMFTKTCMASGAEQRRLYQVSLRLGRRVRTVLGLTNPEDLKRLVFLLYKNIGITMTGEIPGEIVVSECFFARIYSGMECRYISAMDAGIVAGICGDGTMTFVQRMTEGCEQCVANVCVKDTRLDRVNIEGK